MPGIPRRPGYLILIDTFDEITYVKIPRINLVKKILYPKTDVSRKSIAKLGSEEVRMVPGRNGCMRCSTVGAIVHRAVYEDQPCRSQKCLCEAVLAAVHRELQYSHWREFRDFERLVVDPTDMAVHIVEEMLSHDGRIPVSELRSFLELRMPGDSDARSISELTEVLNAFVRAKTRWAIARAHREMNPEMRRIRRGVWKFFSGNPGYAKWKFHRRTLYYPVSTLNTPTADTPMEIVVQAMDSLASGQLSRSIASDVDRIFEILIGKGVRVPALSAGTIAATIWSWSQISMREKIRETCDSEFEAVRLDGTMLIKRTIGVLASGRLLRFTKDKTCTIEECDRIVGAVRGYLGDFIAGIPTCIGDYWEEAFPGVPFDTAPKVLVRRFRNLLQLARTTLRDLGEKYYAHS